MGVGVYISSPPSISQEKSRSKISVLSASYKVRQNEVGRVIDMLARTTDHENQVQYFGPWDSWVGEWCRLEMNISKEAL